MGGRAASRGWTAHFSASPLVYARHAEEQRNAHTNRRRGSGEDDGEQTGHDEDPPPVATRREPTRFIAKSRDRKPRSGLCLDLHARSGHRPGMNLLVNQVKNAMADLAKAKGLTTARVDQKTNAKGELVIALIIPPSRPGEWTER